jgi:hypothetical protein
MTTVPRGDYVERQWNSSTIKYELTLFEIKIQGGSNMTGADLCVNKCKQSRSYLNHLVYNMGIKFIF